MQPGGILGSAHGTNMADLKRRRFLWGLLLAWSTLPPVMYGCANAFKGVSEQKATGLAVVVGGMAEGLVPYGLLLTVIAQTAAIALLVRGFSAEGAGRTVLSVVSICWSVLTLFLLCYAGLAFSEHAALMQAFAPGLQTGAGHDCLRPVYAD